MNTESRKDRPCKFGFEAFVMKWFPKIIIPIKYPVSMCPLSLNKVPSIQLVRHWDHNFHLNLRDLTPIQKISEFRILDPNYKLSGIFKIFR